MPNSGNEVFQEICRLLKPYNPEEIEVRPSTDLTSDLDMDSVAAMDLAMQLEDKFQIDIPISLLSEVRSAQDLVELVIQQQGGN